MQQAVARLRQYDIPHVSDCAMCHLDKFIVLVPRRGTCLKCLTLNKSDVTVSMLCYRMCNMAT